MKRRTHRLRRGFTLSEMLLCVLILSLSTALVAQTFSLGARHFQARTRESEARLLCNTLSLAVQDQLTYAKSARFEGGTLQSFVSGAKGMSGVTCAFSAGTGKLVLTYSMNGKQYTAPLADDAAYAKNSQLRVETFTVKKTADGKFDVTLTLQLRAGGEKTQKISNHFTVTPVLSGVL